ncbi:MAG: adenylate kinase [Proteobacteria bacterium]|nr:adenylate kinase [Pseudomonadota bacterium]
MSIDRSAPLCRIIVRGTCGAGKTVFSRALSELLCIECTELDALHHLPDWRERPTEELMHMLNEVIVAEKWIIDGNYSAVMDEHVRKADAIVWLDYSFVTVLFRLVCRTIRRSITKEELWHGNRETFRKSFFSRDSIFVWMVTTHGRRKRQCREMQAELAGTGIEFLRFSRPRQAEDWLAQLK